MKILSVARRLKHIGRVGVGRDVLYRKQIKLPYQILGNYGAQFAVCTDLIKPDSVIYSFGIGKDVSFDLEIVQRLGAEVHAFDPTPRSLAWLEKQQLPGQFKLHKVGIAALDGAIEFAVPKSSSHVSHSTVFDGNPDRKTISAPVRRLGSIMKELGHASVDLMKLDVEGTEYEVIDDLLSSSINVLQLCVEFHHRWPEVGLAKTRKAIDSLRLAGYKIFQVSDTGEEYSFCQSRAADLAGDVSFPESRVDRRPKARIVNT